MVALNPTHLAAGSHHSLLHSFVSGFNNRLKYNALVAISQSQARVVKTVFENMVRVLEEHKEASKVDERSRRYKAEARQALHLATLHLKFHASQCL